MATTFQATIGTTAVQASAITNLSGVVTRSGLILSLPAANTGSVYYGYTAGVTATGSTGGVLLQNGAAQTINPPGIAGGSLDNLYFIASLAGQTITGEVL